MQKNEIQPIPQNIRLIDEPLLQFAENQVAVDPHDGLALFGPYSRKNRKTPQYMVIGAPEGVNAMAAWSQAMNRPFAIADARKQRLWPAYPGYEVAFGDPWSEPAVTFQIDRNKLIEESCKHDRHERCFAVVELVISAFEKRARKEDSKIDVAICVIPDEVWQNCRPESHVANPVDSGISRRDKELRKSGQRELFDEFNVEQYSFSPDFRRQLKARTMRFDIPLQIIRESTLRLSDEIVFGERRLTRLSDRMWNLATGLYYKSGGKPWKLRSARKGVCYIGIAFRLAGDGTNTACCAAQMFLDSGDGIVFLGEYGPWYSPDKGQFHLSKSAAKQLLEGILKTYEEMEGHVLSEIFLHCRSTIGRDEFAGFQEACPANCKLIGIRVRADGYGARLFRNGTMPVLRGTFLKTGSRGGFLYASGFKPRLATYDGWETPIPLRIDIQHGDAEIEQVATDILGLTKLNYNSCRLGDSQPVTVGFSDAVGEILISNPTVTDRRPNFKYYV